MNTSGKAGVIVITLKNQGYNYEHNYGHGKQNLSNTLAGLMLLAFLIDQLQEHASPNPKKPCWESSISADPETSGIFLASSSFSLQQITD